MFKKKDQFIIGSGFIATKFKKYLKFIKKNNIVIYAAGISNSLEINTVKLNREIFQIQSFLKKNNRRIIYISTYSINDKSRLKKYYVRNKIKIEKIIVRNSSNYLIIRLPEIIGKSNNPYTITNFFYNNIKNQKFFSVHKNSRRNLLDVNDAINNCIKIIRFNHKKNKIINLLNRRFCTPLTIVNNFEKILSKKAIYELKDIKINKWSLKNNYFVNFDKNYLFKTLKKYYI